MRAVGLTALLLSLALPAHADVIFGLKTQNPIEVGSQETDSTAPAVLYRFSDSGALAFSNLGTVRVGTTNIDVDGLAQASNGDLFAFEIGPSGAGQFSHLVQLNATNAQATRRGSQLAGREIRGAMFDGSSRLWAIDTANEKLLQIDPGNGEVIAEITLSQSVSTTIDIAQTTDGTVYLEDIVGTTAQLFFTLDLGTGVLVLVHTDAAPDNEVAVTPALVGLAVGSGGDLIGFGVNGTDDLYRYALPGFARSEFAFNIVPGFNAGRGDLASFVAAVPEAGSLALVFGGLLAWGWVARRGREGSHHVATA